MGMMFVFWGAVIALILVGINSQTARQPRSSGEEALEILKRRYAAGEISQSDYEQAKQALGEA